MKYIEVTRLTFSRITLIISIGYFFIQKTATWINTYFRHASLYEKELRLKSLCNDPNVYSVVGQCSDPTLASVWPVITSFGETLKGSFFCGDVSCSQLLFNFFETWTGLLCVTITIVAISYFYINQMKKKKV